MVGQTVATNERLARHKLGLVYLNTKFKASFVYLSRVAFARKLSCKGSNVQARSSRLPLLQSCQNVNRPYVRVEIRVHLVIASEVNRLDHYSVGAATAAHNVE